MDFDPVDGTLLDDRRVIPTTITIHRLFLKRARDNKFDIKSWVSDGPAKSDLDVAIGMQGPDAKGKPPIDNLVGLVGLIHHEVSNYHGSNYHSSLSLPPFILLCA